jgi:hypothetical protein
MAKHEDSVEKIEKRKLCFVVGPIGEELTSQRKHSDLLLHALIKYVLEQPEFDYSVKRADEDTDPGMIGDRVVSDLIHAEIVVADLTDQNPNVFYEIGIRHSTEKPTIHVAKLGTVLPFDNVSHRTIFVDLTDWSSLEAARTRLAEAARAILRPDYKVSNPITQANASFKMLNSQDPKERIIAQLGERLQRIEEIIGGQSTHNFETLLDMQWQEEMDLALRALKSKGAPKAERIAAIKSIANKYGLGVTEAPGQLHFKGKRGSVSFGLDGLLFI